MKKVIKLKEKDIEQLVRKIINESELNEGNYQQLLKRVERIDNKILKSNKTKAKKEWTERREEIIGQYGDDREWDGMGRRDLENAVDDGEEIIDFYEINESELNGG